MSFLRAALHQLAHWLHLNGGMVVVTACPSGLVEPYRFSRADERLVGHVSYVEVGFQCATCGDVSGIHLREIKVPA